MATLYIAEFDKMQVDAYAQSVMAPHYPPANEQTVTISGASTQSTPMKIGTRFVQLSSDAVCSFVVGVGNPTATTSNSRMAANETRFIGVDPGDIIAVIANT